MRFLSADSVRIYSPVSADLSSHFANERPSRRFAVLELRLLSYTLVRPRRRLDLLYI